jgi:hypothetical protein
MGLHQFLNLALDGGEWSVWFPGCLTCENESHYPLNIRLGYPKTCLDLLEKRRISCIYRDLNRLSSSPWPSHSSDWAVQALLIWKAGMKVWKYSVIQKDGLNFVRLYFLNCTWYVHDLHNIWKRSQIFKYHHLSACLAHSRAAASVESKMATMQHKIFCVRSLKLSRRWGRIVYFLYTHLMYKLYCHGIQKYQNDWKFIFQTESGGSVFLRHVGQNHTASQLRTQSL